MVADTNYVKRVILKLVLDKFKEFALVFKPSVYTLETTTMDRVWKRNGYSEFDGFSNIILIGIKLIVDLPIGVETEDPEYNIISTYIKEEDKEKRYSSNPFQG